MEEISIIEKTRHWQRMLAAEMASIEVKLKAYKDTPTPDMKVVKEQEKRLHVMEQCIECMGLLMLKLKNNNQCT
mgnify:CR=1 FL=1